METEIRTCAEPKFRDRDFRSFGFRAFTSDGFRRPDQNLNGTGADPSIHRPLFLSGGNVILPKFPELRVQKWRTFCSKNDEAYRDVPFMFRLVTSTNDAADVCGAGRVPRGGVMPTAGTPGSGTLWGRGGRLWLRAWARRADPLTTGRRVCRVFSE